MNVNTLNYNVILDTDSYKLSHSSVYPEGIEGMFSYVESRSKDETVMLFGLQMWIKRYLTIPVTTEMIDEAEAFSNAHGEPFNREGWEHIVCEYNGYLPLKIRAVPEGLPLKSGNILVSVECTDPKVFWLASYIETSLQRGVWYPSTIASNDLKIKKLIAGYLDTTSDGRDLLPFMLHDFGGRGVSSEESAQVGGAAHLVNFMGSDTVSGVRAANFYYNSPMSAFSVPATEHSIECSYGPTSTEAREYLNTVLTQFAKPGGIVSIVIDGYNVFREAEMLCTEFREKIIASGAKVVFRPDSGDVLEVIPRLLNLQAATFGFDLNKKGYKKIRYVGIIQGDGVDIATIDRILDKMKKMGFAADNIVFGSGGALLQKVNRDTYKFAQKASAILVDREWKPIFKDPVTDPGKKSKAGKLTLVRSRLNGEYMTLPKSAALNDEWQDMMSTVYENGVITHEMTLDEVRANAAI
jgi:nicotinamide phosphoribosyltransferase